MNNRSRDKARKIACRFKEICGIFNLVRFWTFTFMPELSNEERMVKWNAFITSLREVYPGLQYFGVKELHPGSGDNSGTIHIHCVLDRYVDWHIAVHIWRRIGAGEVIRVDRVPSRMIARYVVKYVSKSIDSSEVKRPVIASRKFCIHLSNFLSWVEKLAGWGRTYLLKFILDKVDMEEYTKYASLRKRRKIAVLRNIAIAIGM